MSQLSSNIALSSRNVYNYEQHTASFQAVPVKTKRNNAHSCA